MRVLIATQHLGIVGGVETYLRAVLPALVGGGLEIAVLAETPDDTAGILAGCPDLPKWSSAGRTVGEVLRDVEHWGPDVVYSQGLQDSRLEAALAGRFPALLYAHNYLGGCVSGTKCFSRPRYQACHRTLGVGCLAAYLPRGCGGRNPLTMLRLYRNERRRQTNLNHFRAVLVASRHMAEEYRRNGVDEERLHIVPLFPPDERPDPAAPGPQPRTDRVLFVGRVTPLKGLDHLIRAMPTAARQLKRELRLVVAGDGPARPAAQELAKSLAVPTEFLGWVTPAERKDQMRRADVLAVPSVWPEPFGLVGIEAGCVGLPAVGYAAGGIPDWLIPGVSGESAQGERPDPIELAAALARALADDGYRQRLCEGAWRTSCVFNITSHVERVKLILESHQ
jgi:glycosyltransferase involved in cell wall biosynthesis